MSISADKPESWLAEHKNLSLIGQGLSWLDKQRSTALEHFEKVGLPGVRDEQWRYTNLRALKSNAYTLNKESSESSIELPSTSNQRMVFVDGFYHNDLSTVDNLNDGIVLRNLSDVLSNNAELIEPYFGASLPKEQHGFTALNTAYCQDGYVLILPKGVVLQGVLEIYFASSEQTEHSISHTRNLIIAEDNSQCTIVERYIGTDGTVYLNNTITEIHAGDNSHIDHYKIQQESNDAFHIAGVYIKQSANSQVKNHNISLGGLMSRNDINCDLLGKGAHIEMNGLVLGNGRQHIDNHTEVNHAMPNCSSDEYYKTIMNDKSRSVFRGRIIVAQDAQLTNADQQNNNLLLSKHAEADTKPQLEIYADDVKCSHGATVGQLDKKSLFYLRSRGIDLDSANALLTFAFANEVIERIKIESVRNELTQIIAGQLLSGLEELL